MAVDKTLYILGAGFSKTFGLPLANEFLRVLIEEGVSETFADKIDTTCRNFYPNYRTALANYPNVEDFYNYFHSLINYHDLLQSDANQYMRSFRREFNLEVCAFLENKVRSISKEDEVYIDEFCKQLKPGDAIITFNWDNILETYLEKHKKKFVFNLKSDSILDEIVILKLHGSIDWFSGFVLPDIESVYQLILEYEDNDGRKRYLLRALQKGLTDQLRREGQDAFIVPPLLYKDELLKTIDCIWGDAYTLMRNYHKKVYIGYSLPKEDMMTRILCTSYHYYANIEQDTSLDGKELILVINPQEEMESHYKKYCHDEIEFHCSTYKRFVDTYVLKKKLQEVFQPFRERLLNDSSDMFIQEVAKTLYIKGSNMINKFEINRLKQYVKQKYNADVDS